MIEADYGEWTGQKLQDLAKTDLWKVVQVRPSGARFPGGESIREMQARAVAALEEVAERHAGEMVVVVSHSDVIKAAVAHFSGLHLDLFQRLAVSPASVTVLTLDGFSCTLSKLSDTGDLEELRPKPAEAGADAGASAEAGVTTEGSAEQAPATTASAGAGNGA
jgi:probable phosphoglycerate mutase